MSERDAFTRAVCANPADDTARLVFADWLDEHGEPERAELIRLQVWHAHNWPTHGKTKGCRCKSCGVFRRCEALLTPERRMEWAGAAFAPSCLIHFYRGFVETIALPAEAFLAHAGAIFATNPVTRVTLSGKAPQNHQAIPTDGRGFGWAGCDPPPYSRHQDVPAELVSVMRTSPRLLNTKTWLTWADFETEAVAQEELSIACVTLGRHKAGLPALARA